MNDLNQLRLARTQRIDLGATVHEGREHAPVRLVLHQMRDGVPQPATLVRAAQRVGSTPACDVVVHDRTFPPVAFSLVCTADELWLEAHAPLQVGGRAVHRVAKVRLHEVIRCGAITFAVTPLGAPPPFTAEHTSHTRGRGERMRRAALATTVAFFTAAFLLTLSAFARDSREAPRASTESHAAATAIVRTPAREVAMAQPVVRSLAPAAERVTPSVPTPSPVRARARRATPATRASHWTSFSEIPPAKQIVHER